MADTVSRERDVLFALFALLQASRSKGDRERELDAAVTQMTGALSDLLNDVTSIELRHRAGAWFCENRRVNVDAGAFAALLELARLFTDHGLGGVTFRAGFDRDELARVVDAIGATAQHDEITARLDELAVRHVLLLPVDSSDEALAEGASTDAGLAETSLKSIFVAHQLMAGFAGCSGVPASVAKHIVRGVVDLLLEEEDVLPILHALVSADPALFAHSVRTCVYAALLGAEVGLPEPLIIQLGTAALLHDIGEAPWPEGDGLSVPREDHGQRGFRRLLLEGGTSDLMLRAMLVCQHHHESPVLTPEGIHAPHGASFFASLVRTADRFDELASQDDSLSRRETMVRLRADADAGQFAHELVVAFERALA